MGGLLLTAATLAQARQADFWSTQNRSLSLHALHTQQNYREIDTTGQTADGTFNSERGYWQGVGLQARWQGHAGTVPLWLQAQTSHSSGQTHYQGYLQSGGQLTPYQARTGNTVQQHSLRLGIPVDVAALWSVASPLQVVPYVSWAHQRWQRNLVQYAETYTHHTHSLGLLVQWQLPTLWFGGRAAHWVLEASHQRGHAKPAQVQVPQFGFDATQAAGRNQQTDISLHYRQQAQPAHGSWGLHIKASRSQYHHGASPIVGGQKSPPNTSRTSTLSAGVVWHY